MTLEALLLDLAKHGRIRHITLGSSTGRRFMAAFRDNRFDGYTCHYDENPVEALIYVLKLKGYNVYPGNDNPEPLPGAKSKRSAMELI